LDAGTGTLHGARREVAPAVPTLRDARAGVVVTQGRTFTAEYRRARRAVFKRAGGVCEVIGCGARATDCDHAIAWADGGSDEESNLRALCREHHRKVTAEQARARNLRHLRPKEQHPGFL
jgi:5-methylcytosine-specific restriction endonuclease McrA